MRHNNLKLMQFEEFIDNAILEDIKDWTNKIPQGDHSANSCIPLDAQKRAQLKNKRQRNNCWNRCCGQDFSQSRSTDRNYSHKKRWRCRKKRRNSV